MRLNIGPRIVAQDETMGLLGQLVVDLGSGTKQVVSTVPVGFIAVPLFAIFHGASASLTAAKVSLGFNAGANDILANTALAGLADSAHALRIPFGVVLSSGQVGDVLKIGVAGDDLGVTVNNQQSAQTVEVEVFGYYVAVS